MKPSINLEFPNAHGYRLRPFVTKSNATAKYTAWLILYSLFLNEMHFSSNFDERLNLLLTYQPHSLHLVLTFLLPSLLPPSLHSWAFTHRRLSTLELLWQLRLLLPFLPQYTHFLLLTNNFLKIPRAQHSILIPLR